MPKSRIKEGVTREMVREWYVEGYTTIEVAEMSGLSNPTVYQWCKDIIRPKSNMNGLRRKGMKNRYEVRGDVTMLYLDRKGEPFKHTMIDTGDLERLKGLSVTWYAHYDKRAKCYYARASVRGNGKVNSLFLHRYLTDAPKGMHVDHFDGNTLNNRRKTNLKVVTPAENVQNQKMYRTNTSGERNVMWVKKNQRWRVLVKANKQIMFCKEYANYDEAVEAARTARKKYLHHNPNRNTG